MGTRVGLLPGVTALPAERAWALLPMAYEALGLPLSTIDTRQHLLAAGNVRAQGRLAGTWVSRYVECGVSSTGLPNADSYVVVLDVRTQMVPSGDGARAGLNTAVRATARPALAGGGMDPTAGA